MNQQEYIFGIEKTLINAKDLFEDAEILFKKNRFSRAYTLYQLSIEEIGKATLIFNFLLHKDIFDIDEQKKIIREFINHKSKTKSSIGLDVLLAFVISDQKLKEKVIYQIRKQEKEIEQLNILKNRSLYTDIIEEKFINPKEIITEKLAKDIKFIAQIRLNIANGFFKFAITNFEQLYKAFKKIDEQEMINNPPPEIIYLANLKIEEIINYELKQQV